LEEGEIRYKTTTLELIVTLPEIGSKDVRIERDEEGNISRVFVGQRFFEKPEIEVLLFLKKKGMI